MARYERVVATRLPADVERELRRRAKADDRTLSNLLRRQLTAMTAGSTSDRWSARRAR
jgi:hypothetical protein